MESCPLNPDSLYASLLGSAWADLHPSVQYFHQGGPAIRGTGRFDICRGSTAAARLLAMLLGLPSASSGCPTRLIIQPDVAGETWDRAFGGHRLVSRQRQASGGLIAERFGALELRFRLHVVDGGIDYQQVAAAVMLGSWRIHLPGWAALHVTAREMPAPDGFPRMNVFVQVSAPLAGDLLSYAGFIAGEDEFR